MLHSLYNPIEILEAIMITVYTSFLLGPAFFTCFMKVSENPLLEELCSSVVEGILEVANLILINKYTRTILFVTGIAICIGIEVHTLLNRVTLAWAQAVWKEIRAIAEAIDNLFGLFGLKWAGRLLSSLTWMVISSLTWMVSLTLEAAWFLVKIMAAALYCVFCMSVLITIRMAQAFVLALKECWEGCVVIFRKV